MIIQRWGCSRVAGSSERLLFHKADTELKNGFVYMVVTEGFFIVDVRLIKRAETNYTESVSPEVVAKARPWYQVEQ